MKATTGLVCYENRHGLVCAYDVESKHIINPNGEDLTASQCKYVEHDPEEVRAELDRRGVKEVLVFTGRLPAWVDGTIPSYLHRVAAFCFQASRTSRRPQSKGYKGMWTAVPVARINDGTDWNDIYPQ